MQAAGAEYVALQQQLLHRREADLRAQQFGVGAPFVPSALPPQRFTPQPSAPLAPAAPSFHPSAGASQQGAQAFPSFGPLPQQSAFLSTALTQPFVPRTMEIRADSAMKAPTLESAERFQPWTTTFTLHLQTYGKAHTLTTLPTTIRLPTTKEQAIKLGQRLSVVQGEPIGGSDPATEARRQQEYADMTFAMQALLFATSKFTEAAAAIVNVPAPNVYEAWRVLNEKFASNRPDMVRLRETEFAAIRQSKGESAETFAANLKLAAAMLQQSGNAPSENRMVTTFVLGLTPQPAQSRRDSLLGCRNLDEALSMYRTWQTTDLAMQSTARREGGAGAYTVGRRVR